jgi:hypothetical protein
MTAGMSAPQRIKAHRLADRHLNNHTNDSEGQVRHFAAGIGADVADGDGESG